MRLARGRQATGLYGTWVPAPAAGRARAVKDRTASPVAAKGGCPRSTLQRLTSASLASGATRTSAYSARPARPATGVSFHGKPCHLRSARSTPCAERARAIASHVSSACTFLAAASAKANAVLDVHRRPPRAGPPPPPGPQRVDHSRRLSRPVEKCPTCAGRRVDHPAASRSAGFAAA